MTLFHSARIKLTAWYLLIIMLVSLSFSAVVYRVMNMEMDRIERKQKEQLSRRFSQWEEFAPSNFPPELIPMRYISPEDILESKKRLLIILGTIDLGILIISAGAGYFLAGKTLRPIQSMLDDQNRFIADASHELRTPLTALKTEIEVNLRDK